MPLNNLVESLLAGRGGSVSGLIMRGLRANVGSFGVGRWMFGRTRPILGGYRGYMGILPGRTKSTDRPSPGFP